VGKSAPKPPDPVKVSAAQGAENRETAEYLASLNRIDQSSPFGSVSYNQSGTDPNTGAPIYSQNTQLSPELQGLFNSQIGSQQGISDAITGAIGRLPGEAFDPSGINTDDVRQRSFDSQMAMLSPKFAEGARNLEVQMSDRGLPIGSEIFTNESDRFDRARNDSMLAAARTADLDASNEHQRQYGNALNEYNMPYQALGNLMGNSQAVGNPQFSGVPQSNMAPVDVAGNTWNAYNAEMDRYNQQQGNMFGGALGLGKLGVAAYSAGMFSDIRLKRDIKRIGAMPSGLPTYRFRYIWADDVHEGVMAHEALHYAPESVSMHPSGFLCVNYALLV
jgi:hypothetical protein